MKLPSGQTTSAISGRAADNGADVVVGMSIVVGPVAAAVKMVSEGGMIILTRMKGEQPVSLMTDRIVLRSTRLQGFSRWTAPYILPRSILSGRTTAITRRSAPKPSPWRMRARRSGGKQVEMGAGPRTMS